MSIGKYVAKRQYTLINKDKITVKLIGNYDTYLRKSESTHILRHVCAR